MDEKPRETEKEVRDNFQVSAWPLDEWSTINQKVKEGEVEFEGERFGVLFGEYRALGHPVSRS